jgi:acyl-CoA reductase-like NAD-dependent aldehyde dehydrogenase
VGPWVTAHPGIDKVSFTGSTNTGRRVMASASANLKRLTLELGGNDAAIVLPDVDVAKIAEQLFWGAFRNSGQLCVATKRLYVHSDVYDAVAAELVKIARRTQLGDGLAPGTELGPIQNRTQFERVTNLIEDARSKGLKFLIGGQIPEGEGYFVPVTIVDNPPDDSRVVVEEAFGPVLPLLRFNDVEEVIRRANASEYGLAASVWSSDAERAKQIGARLDAGTVWVNEIHYLMPWTPFGGHKQSGVGVENGVDGLLQYTNAQTLSVGKMPVGAAA